MLRQPIKKILNLLYGLTMVSLTLSFVSSSVSAAERQYLVEVIAFEHVNNNTEHQDNTEDFSRYSSQSERSIVDDSQLTASPINWRRTGPLRPQLDKLAQSDQYRILGYRAWRQPLASKRQTQVIPVILSAGAGNTPMTGDITVFENQLVYAQIELSVDNSHEFNQVSPWGRKQTIYKINETRRIRLNENHYFDHPYIGAIIRLSRVEKQ